MTLDLVAHNGLTNMSMSMKLSVVENPRSISTRPEVSKLTPESTRNSQVAKLSPAESRLKHIDRHTKTMNSF